MVKLVTKYRGKEVPFPSKTINKAAERLSPRNLQRLTQFAEQEMRRYLNNVSKVMHERHSRPYQKGFKRKTLQKRSGRGLQSIKNFLVNRQGDGVTGHMRLNKYMTMHEHGGWIRAKKGKYLTIPLDAALNANGTPKKRNARAWQNTFVRKSKKGNLIIFQKRGKRIVPLYVLKEKVRIPARLGLRVELRKGRAPMRKAIIQRIKLMVKDQGR
jgi:hypothetical protein